MRLQLLQVPVPAQARAEAEDQGFYAIGLPGQGLTHGCQHR